MEFPKYIVIISVTFSYCEIFINSGLLIFVIFVFHLNHEN